MDLLTAAKQYWEAGLNVLPAKDKRPIGNWKKYREELCATWDKYADMMGVVCGRISGNLQAIDFDLKAVKFDAWRDRVLELGGEVARVALSQVVVERSRSGGKHVCYRVDAPVAGNQKLCATKDGCAIETRGEGGFLICAPTDGYVVESGDWLNLPVLPRELDEIFLGVARSLSEIVKEETTYSPSTFSGIDVADELRDAGVKEILARNGWTYVGDYQDGELWRRPGKSAGISGMLHTDTQMFWVFSSNAAPLEPRSYTPLQLLAALEYGGDESDAAKELMRDKPVDAVDFAVVSTVDAPKPVKISALPEFPKEVLNAPGTLGEMTAFVESFAKRSQPVLSFASSLATFGHLLARRVAAGGAMDTSPACWIIAISPPSSGKGAGLYAARMLSSLDDGDDLATEYESVQVFVDAMAATGKQFLLQDEFGSWLTEVNGARLGDNRRRLIDTWLQIFSAYNVRKYNLPASLRRGKQPPMNCPAFSLYGVTNFDDFQTGMTGKLLKNGFVARTLFVVGDSKSPRRFDDEGEIVIPASLEERWRDWLAFRPPTDLNVCDPYRVAIDVDAEKLLKEYGEERDRHYLAIDDSELALKTIEGRAYEKTLKYALLFACSKYGTAAHIDVESVELAIKLNRYESATFLYLMGNVLADTEEERFVNEVARWLATGVTTFGMPELTQIVKNKAMRDAVLDDLIARGYISVELVKVGNQRKPKKVFRSNL